MGEKKERGRVFEKEGKEGKKEREGKLIYLAYMCGTMDLTFSTTNKQGNKKESYAFFFG